MALRVAQVVTSLARGGAQATVLGSSHDLGSDVDIVVLAGPDDPGEGTCWTEAARLGVATIPVPHLRRAVDPLADVRALAWLVRWLADTRPDVVHTHSAKAGLLGRVAASLVGIPTVHTVHGWSSASMVDGPAATAKRLAMVRVERLLARRSEALVVVTPVDAETGLRQGIGRVDQYRLIRSGIDLTIPRRGAARRAQLRRDLGLDDRFVVGTVGRLAAQKDIATLVAGFVEAGLESAQLLIVGDGPDRSVLERQVEIRGWGDQIRFLGHRRDASELVGSFDAFVSTARWEGLPRTIVEAMAARVPVVATPVGGVPEIVIPGVTGSLVPVGDPQAVAGALRCLVEHPERARTMADEAEGLVTGFGQEQMRSDLVALWHEVAARSRSRRAQSRSGQEKAATPTGVG